MEMAIWLLINLQNSIQSIADGCGFNEAWYFNSVFSKYRGMTPGFYCQKHKSI